MTITEFQGKYRWLSNFWKAPMNINGIDFFCNEQWYCYNKSTDPKYRELILSSKTAGQIKKLGRMVKLSPTWDKDKVGIMRVGLEAKFIQNEDLREKLVETDDEHIQEGNKWHDVFWGIDLETGEGQNMLGKLLMELRKHLKDE